MVFLSSNKGFETKQLPVYAQLGPINKSLCLDVNKDGNLDIVAAGNNYAAEVETIRYDGGRGVVLLGDGKGNFTQLSPQESGFFEMSDCKDMMQVSVGGRTVIISVSNREKAKSFILN